MRKFTYIYIIGLFAVGLSSCEKVVDIDLNTADPKLVVTANVIANTQELNVEITQTTSYFSTESVPTVTDAAVTLYDHNGIAVNVPHITNGLYSVSQTTVANNNYSLEVLLDGDLYRATSFLLDSVSLDSLTVKEVDENTFTGPGGGGGGSSSQIKYIVYCEFDDPVGVDNYYRINYVLNGVPADPTEIQVIDGRSFDGDHMSIPIYFGRKLFNSGDMVEVELVSFDKAAYDYYLSLADIVSNGGKPIGENVAPGNPINNWNGEILGYFIASSEDTLSVQIP